MRALTNQVIFVGILVLGALAHSQNASESAQFLTDAIAKSMKSTGPKSAELIRKDGPAIDHYFIRAGRVQVQKATYPEPENGQKVVILRLPESDEGKVDLDYFQVGISFTVKRLMDVCNRSLIQGEAAEFTLANDPGARYFDIAYSEGRMASSLKGCLQSNKEMRNVEIVTDLKQLQPFRDNLVLYVPENVEVTGQVWKRARIVQGIAP